MLVQVFCNNIDRIKMHHFDLTDTHYVLLQDGVYLLTALLAEYPEALVSCLKSDAVAAGSFKAQLDAGADDELFIDDAQWVRLCSEHDKIISIQ